MTRKQIEEDIKKAKVIAEPYQCVSCKGWFPRSTKAPNSRLARGIKQRNAVTCSPGCSVKRILNKRKKKVN